jgi:hypothetical protein
MHIQQVNFINSVKVQFPDYFTGKSVLDVGSQDLNGNNRQFFTDCEYLGLDICEGRNVDVVGYVHEWAKTTKQRFDVIISGEMLEHDQHYIKSVKAMYGLTKKGGLLVITCAAPGRPEHGTSRSNPNDSPATNDYYMNIDDEMLMAALNGCKFKECKAVIQGEDLYFYGLKP